MGVKEVKLIASESLGVRSMALSIGPIVIDPSASLAPHRFGLPPHPREWEALVVAAKRIVKALERAEVVIITHYHRDHYNPGWLYDNSILDGKLLLIKDYKKNINVSQKIRAYKFLKMVNARVEVADGKTFEYGEFKIEFSPPLPHGESEKLGYVLAVKVNDVVYSSDIQGGVREEHKWVNRGARLFIIDGPPLYLGKVDVDKVKKFLESLRGEVVVDHHSYRSLDWREKIGNYKTYASFQGVEETPLEARRKRLYEEEPVEERWLKMKFHEMREMYFPAELR